MEERQRGKRIERERKETKKRKKEKKVGLLSESEEGLRCCWKFEEEREGVE